MPVYLITNSFSVSSLLVHLVFKKRYSYQDSSTPVTISINKNVISVNNDVMM